MKTGSPLTPRQRKVLTLMAEGLSHKEIADVMKVSRATVKKHIVNACDKFTKDKHFRSVIQHILLQEP